MPKITKADASKSTLASTSTSHSELGIQMKLNAHLVAGDVDSMDGSEEHDESKVEQDVHAKDQMNGELLDDVEDTNGKAARTDAEKAEESPDESEESDSEVYAKTT